MAESVKADKLEAPKLLGMSGALELTGEILTDHHQAAGRAGRPLQRTKLWVV